jgi:hypothetical protein
MELLQEYKSAKVRLEKAQKEFKDRIIKAAAAEKDYRKASRIFGRNCQRLSCRRG